MISHAEHLVTVFGGAGFIGRYVCERLFKAGVRVRVASRDPRNAYFLQPLAQVGQFGFEKADITNLDSVRNAVKSATAVVNLCGLFGRSMRRVHVDGARNVAQAAREAGARALVQISAIGADPNAQSEYGRTKGEGERAVRDAFAGATIIRPSLVFGPEDDLTNRFAAMARLPFLPVIASRRNFQPVYVRDLAKAIGMAALEPARFGGKTYDVGGPQVMSMAELHHAIFEITGQDPEIVHLPDILASAIAHLGWLPGAPLTRDQWLMLQRDNVPATGAPGLEAFGIEPTPLAAVGREWLGRFNRGGKFAGRRINLTATS
ncbi:complex I NDUFA9 subunit family protein [Sphingomonas segetis]|jgi:NADH dehydrogenase|uniref:complex I NDUFA9 subunit family protein n=1 Tax=Sphingomonas segetis TaxID=1104779 RepID=UPI0012D2BAC7|nr:complex I NDUFA9 subunit family protein [Sphingomonas segetis]